MTQIAFTSLFTPNPDKLTLFCLVENWPEEPIKCVWDKMTPERCIIKLCDCAKEELQYGIARTRALQSSVPFEDQWVIKGRVWNEVFRGKNEFEPFPDWQPREGDNWKVPEGLGWDKVRQSRRKRNPGAAIGPQEWCNLHPSDTYGANSFYIEYREVIRLKAAEPESVKPNPLFTKEDMYEIWQAGCQYATGFERGYSNQADDFKNAIKTIEPYSEIKPSGDAESQEPSEITVITNKYNTAVRRATMWRERAEKAEAQLQRPEAPHFEEGDDVDLVWWHAGTNKANFKKWFEKQFNLTRKP